VICTNWCRPTSMTSVRIRMHGKTISGYLSLSDMEEPDITGYLEENRGLELSYKWTVRRHLEQGAAPAGK